jgi:hypothetical protein
VGDRAKLVGIHHVEAAEPVHLLEIEIEGDAEDFDFGEVTQELPGQPRSNWQVAYDEREVGRNSGYVRFAFFFHYLNFKKPLLSSVGPLDLPPDSPVPDHLRDIVYEEP